MCFNQMTFIAIYVVFYCTTNISYLVLGLDSESTDHCCDVGVTWHSASRGRCPTYAANIQNVTQENQAACSAVVNICCLREQRSRQCQTGRLIATQRHPASRRCTSLYVQRQPPHRAVLVCCNCCMLGLLARQSTSGCVPLRGYSIMCTQSYEECCHGDDLIMTTVSMETNVNTSQYSTLISTLVSTTEATLPEATSGLCRRFRGQLCQQICTSTPTSYKCSCRQGYTLMTNGRSCRETLVEDPCEALHCHQSCVINQGIATCNCDHGYRLNPDRRTCVDVNECSLGSHRCRSDETCVNNDGGFDCVTSQENTSPTVRENCQAGYSLNVGNRLCEDIDECMLRRHSCSYPLKCVNTPGSYRCTHVITTTPGNTLSTPQITPNIVTTAPVGACQDGYRFDSIYQRCLDINECTTGLSGCSGGPSACINTEGSYRCSCDRGYTFNYEINQCDDMNECALGLAPCSVGQQCENTVGSYKCRRTVSCGTGYTLDQSTQQCLDNDECKLNTHNCGTAWECRNTLGSFRCVKKDCLLGWSLNLQTGQCDKVLCPRGLKADAAANCIDINECIEHPTICRPTQQCHNTIGSFRCSNVIVCTPGYELNAHGTACTDIDECSKGLHDCTDGLQTCVNRRGSYVCQCPEGYQIDLLSESCEDIDECLRYGDSVCAQNARCENSIGSFYCRCNTGYQSADSNPRSVCEDVDECTVNGLCDHECRNTYGTYHCVCRNGFELAPDSRTCHDLNECELWQDRPGGLCLGMCENTAGSYTCSCPRGYRMGNDGKTCNDIDECSERTARCFGTQYLCVNTRGSYQCENIECPSGFLRVPTTNQRNRNIHCQRRSFTCQAGDTACLEQPISYTMNFITFPVNIRIPATLFTMRGHGSIYRRLEFEMQLISAEDPLTGQSRVSRSMFQLVQEQSRPNECQIVLLERVNGAHNVVLKLKMLVFNRALSSTQPGAQPHETFYGTAEALIKIFITVDPWDNK